MRSGMPFPLTFHVYRGEALIRTETLTQDIIKIGKLSSSHLQLDEESVSRMHALIEVSQAGEVTLVDLGSSQGTFVNGRRVTKAALAPGDEIKAGEARLVVTFDAPGLPVAPQALVPPPPARHFGAPAQAAALSVGVPQIPQHVAEQVEVRDGRHSIEVSALFEDAVIEVRHLSDPTAGRITGVTRAILGSGAAALLALVVLFLVSYAQVGRLRVNREQWDRSGQPGQFHAPREGTGRDAGALFLLIYGVGALLLSFYRLAGVRRDPDFTIGTEPGCTFAAPAQGLPTSRFPLVRAAGTGYELLFTQALEGDADLGDGQKTPLASLAASGAARPSAEYPGAFALPLGASFRASLRHGENTFNVAAVPRPRRYPTPFAIDWGMQSYTAGVFVITATFLLLIFSLPPDPRSLSVDAFLRDQRMISILVKPPEVKDEASWLEKVKAQEQAQRSPAQKSPTGKVGNPRAPEKNLVARTDKPLDRAALKKEIQDQVSTVGVIGLIKSSSSIASILARDTLGEHAEEALIGLVGTEVADNFGPGAAIISTGRGPGADGVGENTLGVGNLGKIGSGCCGHGPGNPYGTRVGRLTARHAGIPDPPLPPVVNLIGTLDKDLIRRTIRQHVNEIKFCYEKELTRNNSLEGRVMVQFTISTTGQVVSSVIQSSSMHNAQVEQCIAGAVHRWQFPKPPAGIVIVSYPFVLKSGG